MKGRLTPLIKVGLVATFSLGLSIAPTVRALPIITSVVETGGDNEPIDTIAAKWTGVTFVNGIAGEPVPGKGAADSYTAGLFGNHAPCYVDRYHRYTNASATVAIPAYLMGAEYIMSGDDNRDNPDYTLDVTVTSEVRVYMLIDNRLGDLDTSTPPTFDATHMQWMVDEGWTPVVTGACRAATPGTPDEVAMDEFALGGQSLWFSIYSKLFPAGTFRLRQADNRSLKMYGVVVATNALANDNFADRISISGTNLTIQGSNTRSSTEPGENIGDDLERLASTVWYSWTAPTNGLLRVSGSASQADFQLRIGTFRGTAVDALVATPAAPDGGIPVTRGETILFQVGSVYAPPGGGGSGIFTMNLVFEAHESVWLHDAFANRIEIATARYHLDGDIYGTTSEPGEPLPEAQANHTLWWRYDAADQGLLNVMLTTGDFQPRLSVYEGTALTALSPLVPVSGTRYLVVPGRHYAIQIAGGEGNLGTFTLDVHFYSASNDFFTGSERILGTNVEYQSNFRLATAEEGEPTDGPTNSVWVSWEASMTGRVYYLGPATTYVYTGPTLPHLQRIYGRNERTGEFLATEGSIYHFRMAGTGQDFTLTLQQAPLRPTTNDNFADAIELQGYAGPQSVLGATMEPGEPLHLGTIPQKSIWWKWRANLHGVVYVAREEAVIPNVVFAVYQGDSVETLTLVAKATNGMVFSVVHSETYYLAVAVPADVLGDTTLYYQATPLLNTPTFPVPNNLLKEPSWEGARSTEMVYWHYSGELSGVVNERRGIDGMYWPILHADTTIWQDVPTVPGHLYRIRFAHHAYGGGSIPTQARVLWGDQLVGTASGGGSDAYWTWSEFFARASNSVTQVRFENLLRWTEMDAFSVVDLSSPPTVTKQPVSATVVPGGTVSFSVTADGAPTLLYQWYHNGSPLSGATNRVLILAHVNASQAGSYHATIGNPMGSVSSSSALLTVESTTAATILVQPTGGLVPLGGYAVVNVIAVGTGPLQYQWYRNGTVMAEATNRSLIFTNFQHTSAGTYEVLIQNVGGSVWSLPANLVATNQPGGGLIDFRNGSFPTVDPLLNALIYDVDVVTPLNGPRYLAQLYAGSSIESIRPAGEPTPFRTGFGAGYFIPRNISLPNVPPATLAYTQVRVWEQGFGASYEEARALGGKFGRSDILTVVTGGGNALGARLFGLTRFSLQAGRPGFTTGLLKFKQQLPDGQAEWILEGEAGFRYLVEQASSPDKLLWRPYRLLTNNTGTVTFLAVPGSENSFFRARILD